MRHVRKKQTHIHAFHMTHKTANKNWLKHIVRIDMKKKTHIFLWCFSIRSARTDASDLLYQSRKKKWIWQNTPLFCCLECSPSPQVRGTHKKSHSAITETTYAAWFWLRCVVRTNACIIFVIDWKKIGIMMSARRLSSVFDWMKINQNQMGKT